MARASDKRAKLVKAADRLFHRRGFERSSIADVATEAGVPAGNVYYYFKTKDELVDAVVADRNRRMDHLFANIEREPDPLKRLSAFVERYEEVRDDRAAHGCPIGNLCRETNQIGGELAETAAVGFARMVAWLERQFMGLGLDAASSRARALHLLACLQGAMLVAHTFKDPGIISAEVDDLQSWLRDVAAEASVMTEGS